MTKQGPLIVELRTFDCIQRNTSLGTQLSMPQIQIWWLWTCFHSETGKGPFYATKALGHPNLESYTDVNCTKIARLPSDCPKVVENIKNIRIVHL